MMRDLDVKPYSPDEQRVADFFVNECGVGGGDDPIGSLIASHAFLVQDRNRLRAALKPFADAVYNDNGDLTVGAADYDAYVKAYFTVRRGT